MGLQENPWGFPSVFLGDIGWDFLEEETQLGPDEEVWGMIQAEGARSQTSEYEEIPKSGVTLRSHKAGLW